MRFSLSILNGSLFNLELDTDADEDDAPVKPPFGFAGSGPGVTETADDVDPLDRPDYTIDRSP